ncbi:hypothetical protein C0J52_18779, partial [Blattella germanica]
CPFKERGSDEKRIGRPQTGILTADKLAEVRNVIMERTRPHSLEKIKRRLTTSVYAYSKGQQTWYKEFVHALQSGVRILSICCETWCN